MLGIANESKLKKMKNGKSVDAKEVTDLFVNALDKAEKAYSATINTNVNIALTENEETTSTQQDITIKYNVTNAEQTKSDTAADIKADFSIINTYNGEKEVTDAYFGNGTLYYEYEGQKVKEEADYDDLMSTVASYTIGFTEDAVESSFMTNVLGESRYIIKFDAENMDQIMNGNNVTNSQTEDETIRINYAYLYFVVDKNDTMKGFNMEIDASFKTSGENDEQKTSPFKYSLAANFTDIDDTVVKAFDHLEEYVDINTVVKDTEGE